MEALLISACLLGENCKYSGGNNALPEDVLERLRARYDLVPVCPEVMGGLPTPRLPSERQGDRVVNRAGKDVTAQFRAGAKAALEQARRHGCRKALLKSNSPSCGCGQIYDGSFSGKLIPGDGVCAELLKDMDLEVFGENCAEFV